MISAGWAHMHYLNASEAKCELFNVCVWAVV